MIARKVAPALAAGCTIVLKPSELTPVYGARAGVPAVEAGVPGSAFNIVTARRSPIGEGVCRRSTHRSSPSPDRRRS